MEFGMRMKKDGICIVTLMKQKRRYFFLHMQGGVTILMVIWVTLGVNVSIGQPCRLVSLPVDACLSLRKF